MQSGATCRVVGAVYCSVRFGGIAVPIRNTTHWRHLETTGGTKDAFGCPPNVRLGRSLGGTILVAGQTLAARLVVPKWPGRDIELN